MTLMQLPDFRTEHAFVLETPWVEADIPEFVHNYNTDHMTHEEVCKAAIAAGGDEPLFVGYVGLSHFMYREANNLLGPHEDRVKLYYSYLGVILSRREALVTAAQLPVSQESLSQAA